MKTYGAVVALGMALSLSAWSGQPEKAAARASAGTAAKAGAAALARIAQEEANKKVVLEFFRDGITADERYELMHPDYIQHNPVFKRFGEINGTRGREEFRLLLESRRVAANAPPAAVPATPAPAGDKRYMVMADGDVVTVLQKRYQPDPLKPGEYYESFWYDTWRVKDGKLYEHWDAATIDPKNIPDILKAPVSRAAAPR
jgi:predicted SnoaL-like aldol condensation-catalyzing enzyme